MRNNKETNNTIISNMLVEIAREEETRKLYESVKSGEICAGLSAREIKKANGVLFRALKSDKELTLDKLHKLLKAGVDINDIDYDLKTFFTPCKK